MDSRSWNYLLIVEIVVSVYRGRLESSPGNIKLNNSNQPRRKERIRVHKENRLTVEVNYILR